MSVDPSVQIETMLVSGFVEVLQPQEVLGEVVVEVHLKAGAA